MAKPSRPKYRQPCECGECPRLPKGRPPTLGEWLAYWDHDGWFPPDKAFRLAVECYVGAYATWVNTRGWRKPPGWRGERVPLRRLTPKGKRIFPEDASRAVRKLLKEGRPSGVE